LEKEGSKSTSAERYSRRNLKMRPEYYRLMKLDMPVLKPRDNFVLPHHLKNIIRQFNLQVIPRLCCTFLQFHATLLTKNLLNQKLASTPLTHFSKNRGMLLQR